MSLSKPIRDILDAEIPTAEELEFDHEQGCGDCNGHDVFDYHEWVERRLNKEWIDKEEL
jgi:hypothetical protein